MTDVFVSYKREDELRVGRLVQALEKKGLSVWWDRGLPGGEQWRAQIEAALAQSKSAVVVWTKASTGPDGTFVKDEAGRAARRQILVPVMMESVELPLGFGELQAINLVHWRGSTNDPFFLDLISALRAKMEGRDVPAPQGPVMRLRKRLTAAGAGSALVALATAFATNTLNLQNTACALPIAQPWASDACGAAGLGNRPTRAERTAWEERTEGDCESFRQHLRQFPDGAYRDTAAAALSGRTVTTSELWAPVQRPLRLVVGRDAPVAATDVEAKAAALQRGRKKAETMCRDFEASGLVRFRVADVEAQEWMCDGLSAGTVCGFEGRALCGLDELSKREREVCVVDSAQ